MHLGLRLLFAFLAITGVAAFFVLRVFVTEIKPSVREVMEDLMVDTANLLAEVAAPELAQLPAGAVLEVGDLSAAVASYRQRSVDVKIWGLHKTTLDLRVVLTDATGRVVFDSGTPSAVGQDYSRWRDVTRTLRGEYGARTSRSTTEGVADPSPVMFVAAPVRSGGHTIGAMVVAKPMSSIAPFIERAERKVLVAGVVLLGLSLAIGVAVTLWTVRAVRQLQRFALAAGNSGAEGSRRSLPAPPDLPGELGELARAMDQMQHRLQGRERLEQHVRALTHELKSPLAAIQGAAELLLDPLPEPDRQRFVRQVGEQSQRLHLLVEQMLELSKVESLQAPPAASALDWADLTEQVLAEHRAALEQRALRCNWSRRDAGLVLADHALLKLALSNLLSNAIGHAPQGSELTLELRGQPGHDTLWSLRDRGPGVPDYALPRLGERFYTAPGPASEGGPPTRGSGLGLAIVRRVMWLHGGELRFESAAPGLRVLLTLPSSQG
ncbi:MAG: two-component system sensor histidine kinase CreC [Rubrivivax sp.]|jgi:two-component system sensor histidine kinase CreC|nr:two-component system sensor histidine kinase CreC [Rubrivivax sp.]